MSSANNTEVVAAYIKTESTYNTYASPANTDAIRVVKPFEEPAINYAYDGERAPSNLGWARIQQAAPLGRTVESTIRTEAKGRGAAYTSSSVEVPDIHRLLKSAGLTAAVTTTGGSELWTFTPTAATAAPSSTSAALYARGKLFPVAGIYNSFRVIADGPGIPVWEFPFKGTMVTNPSNATPAPSFTVPTIVPPSAAPIIVTIAGTTLTWVIRSFTYDHGREFGDPRVSLIAADGHAGFSIGPRRPFLEMVVEESSTLQSTPFYAAGAFDPYNLHKNAAGLALTLRVGATQYNKYIFSFTAGQFKKPEAMSENSQALMKLRYEPYTSAAESSVDDFSLVFD